MVTDIPSLHKSHLWSTYWFGYWILHTCEVHYLFITLHNTKWFN